MRMITTVNERGRNIATFRAICVWMMETAARWTPVSPEMEVKCMFGRHIWDYAQMADQLGKRTFELRLPEQHSMAPVPVYAAFLKEAAGASSTADRIATLYDGIIPGVIARFKAYIAATDPILDEPSIVALENIIRDLDRHRTEAADIRRELKLASSGAGASIAAKEKGFSNILAEEEKVPA